jgi:hypothetical protein
MEGYGHHLFKPILPLVSFINKFYLPSKVAQNSKFMFGSVTGMRCFVLEIEIPLIKTRKSRPRLKPEDQARIIDWKPLN